MTCRCWNCRRRRGLAAVAPRLTAAYRAEVALRPVRSAIRRELAEAERLVAHRDLQLVRSGARTKAAKDKRYMAYRQRKLDRAQQLVAEAKARLEAVS